MPTNTVMITDALLDIAIVADGQTASASQISDGLKSLNQMMATWAVSDMDIGYFPQDTASDDCPIPTWSEEAVRANLGVALASAYRVPVSLEIAQKATTGASTVARMVINNKLEGVDNDHMPQGASNNRWNIDTDNF